MAERTPPHLAEADSVLDFSRDPLAWLLRASRRGPHAVLRSHGPVLSRSTVASGTVALFGPQAVRTVLGDTETFGMPVSVSVRHELPRPLANLNAALFSMTGDQHRQRRRLLSPLLGPGAGGQWDAAVDRGIDAFLRDLPEGVEISLMGEMRRLAGSVAEEVLLGPGAPIRVGAEIQRYFDQRRFYAAREAGGDRARFDALVEQGERVDGLLRERIQALKQAPPATSVIGRLCNQAHTGQVGITEDELVAHANVLFMSSSEPIATAMAWILLVLSQHPDLRAALRREADPSGAAAAPLLAGTVREVLRLVPPSAIIVRLTTAETRVAGLRLPAGCEVVLSPFAEHRRPQAFPNPDQLRPGRWAGPRPDHYEFLAFGAGSRACLGRYIALLTLERATAAILRRADPVLPRAQPLDWRMSVTLMPTPDPHVRLDRLGMSPSGHALCGPAADLLPDTVSL